MFLGVITSSIWAEPSGSAFNIMENKIEPIKKDQVNISKKGGMVTVYTKHGKYVTSAAMIQKLLNRNSGFLYVDTKEVNDVRLKAYNREKRMKEMRSKFAHGIQG